MIRITEISIDNLGHAHLGIWSIESQGRPQLLAPKNRGPGVRPDYYTADEIREVVRHGRIRIGKTP